MGLEYLEYLFGGLIYLVSSRFREKKNKKWAKESQMYKIYEIGMWVSIPVISCLVVIAVIAQQWNLKTFNETNRVSFKSLLE